MVINVRSETNRRKLERFELRMFAWIENRTKGIKRNIAAFTRDISATGAFFLTDDSFALGDSIQAIVLVPFGRKKVSKNDSSALFFDGQVVRLDDSGIAVAFEKSGEIMSVF